MLQALYQLAKTENLVEDPAFEMRPVAWTIDLDQKGRFLGFTPNHYLPPEPQEDGRKKKKKPKELVKRFLVPRQFIVESGASRTSGPYAYFLVDKGDYTLGFQPESQVDVKQPDERLQHRHALFIEKVSACYAITKHPAIEAVVVFLQQVAANGLPAPIPEKATTNDLYAFRVAPDTERHIHEIPEIADYWRAICAPGKPESVEGRPLNCLVSGQPVFSQGLFPSIKRVPGGTTSGAGLVSFNAKAFESYGWKSEENAPISKDAAQHCAVALNRLLDPNFERSDGTKLPRRSMRIGKDTVLVYWSKNPLADQFWIILNPSDDASQVKDVIRSIWTGKLLSDDHDGDLFYAATLTGSQGRIIVRDWIETKSATLKTNIANHFDQLKIVPITRPPKGKTLPPINGANTLLQSAVLDGKPDNIPPPLAAEFIHAILSKTDYPIALLHRTLQRQRMEMYDGTWTASWRADSRAALCKAFLSRNFKHDRLTKIMNPTETNTAYLLGRLLACYGEMQRLAHYPRQVNATLVDKFYGQFSSNPLTILPSLDAVYKNNRKTALKNQAEIWLPGRARNIDQTVGRIFLHLSTSLAGEFGIESQALFVLGFHHQQYWLQMKEDQRNEWLQTRNIDSNSTTTIL